METVTAILSRRSVRVFLPEPVEPEKLEILFRAAMQAPSAANEQPWQFVLITDREQLDLIRKVHPYAAMLKTAPLAILICGDLRLELAPGNWVLDCSCAAENLLLAAHDAGLGAVWTGIFPEKDRMQALAEVCRLPERVIPLALIAVGYPASAASRAAPDRFDPRRVHLNTWDVPYEFQG